MPVNVNEIEPDKKIVEIEMERLREFRNHPFKVKADAQMLQLIESISKYGILNPLIVRPLPEGTVQNVRQKGIDSIRYPELIIKLAETQEGIINKQDVVDLLKRTSNQAYTLIKKLQREGKLELLCGGKYAKYKLIE